jgi:hypothetical protein
VLAVSLLAFGEIIDVASVQARAILALGAAALVAGHVAMLSARRRAHAGRNTRRVLATVTAVLAVAAIGGQLAHRVPRDAIGVGATLALAIVLAAIFYRVASELLHRLLAPFGGRLLSALDEARAGSVGVSSLEELGAAVLPPLRRGSATLEADPLLFILHPPRQVRADAAGVAHVTEREPSPAILEHLSAKPGEVVVSAPLVEQVVRRPDLRALVEALAREDALAIVPLSMNLELEGYLIVPRGRRRAALTLEEIARLEALARTLSAQVAMLSAQERARLRTGEAIAARERLEEALEAASEEIAKLRADARVLRAGGAPAPLTS